MFTISFRVPLAKLINIKPAMGRAGHAIYIEQQEYHATFCTKTNCWWAARTEDNVKHVWKRERELKRSEIEYAVA